MRQSLHFRYVVALAVAGLLAAPQAFAQAYPNKPVRLIVPFPAGGPADVLGRTLAQKLGERWGQQVIVDNRAGGSTVIGAEAVAKAAPDGYTLLLPIDSTLTMNQALFSKLPYDPLKDFTHVTIAVTQSLVFLANDKTTARTAQDAVAEARAGGLNFASGTVSAQIAGELFSKMAGVKLTNVPYKGSSEVVKGMLSGDVPISFDGIAPNLPHVKSGKFRALATTGLQRSASLPDIPTLHELGYRDYEVRVWLGISAPAGTPRDIVNKLNSDMVAVLNMPDVKERLLNLGLEVVASTPEQFVETIKREQAKFVPLIRELGLKLD